MRIHEFITYFVKLLLSTRCRGAGLLYMAAEEMFGKRVIVTVHGEREIIWTTREKPDFMRVYAA